MRISSRPHRQSRESKWRAKTFTHRLVLGSKVDRYFGDVFERVLDDAKVKDACVLSFSRNHSRPSKNIRRGTSGRSGSIRKRV